MNWPQRSGSHVFKERRARFLGLHSGRALLTSGLARVRNFLDNQFPFRAESHFLYFIGQHLEASALLFEAGSATLYVTQAPVDDALWAGPEKSLEQLAEELGLPVRPITELEELDLAEDVATLPPQDAESAEWASDLLDRDVVAGSGDELSGLDEALAKVMITLRLTHDAGAVAQFRQAISVTALAHRAGMAVSAAGVREAQISAAMSGPILAAGLGHAYEPIVTCHGEVLHDHSRQRVATDGDLVLADVGAESLEGFAADVTRTWPVNGRFSATQRAAYEAVLHAQEAALAAVAPGVSYLAVHQAARDALTDALVALGLLQGSRDMLLERGAAALFFPHGIGHLLGLDVHDMEDLGDRAGYAPGRERATSHADRYLRLNRDLTPGMVVTIEPGFYQIPLLLQRAKEDELLSACINWQKLEAFRDVRGIRIEDDVLVTQTGAEVLSAEIPKQPEEIERLVGAR